MSPAYSDADALAHYVLDEGFRKGLFSDVTVQVLRRTYSLHRFLLARSPYLRRLLSSNARANLVLHVPEEFRVDSQCVEIALQYLYMPSAEAVGRLLQDENVFTVLNAATWLELDELCQACVGFVQARLGALTIPVYVTRISSELCHGKYGEVLRHMCMSFLLRTASASPEVLARLPLDWFRRVIASDALAVSCEFERYNVLKQVIELRRSRPVLQPVSLARNAAARRGHGRWTTSRPAAPGGKCAAEPTKCGVKRGPSDAAGELDDENRNKVIDLTDDDEECGLRRISPSPSSSTSSAPLVGRCGRGLQLNPAEETMFREIFENDIIYTHMTFDQLQVLSEERLVSQAKLKEAHWRAGELATRVKNRTPIVLLIPRFRFGVTFCDLRQKFCRAVKDMEQAETAGSATEAGDDDNPDEGRPQIHSEPVQCAGGSYRVVLFLAEMDGRRFGAPLNATSLSHVPPTADEGRQNSSGAEDSQGEEDEGDAESGILAQVVKPAPGPVPPACNQSLELSESGRVDSLPPVQLREAAQVLNGRQQRQQQQQQQQQQQPPGPKRPRQDGDESAIEAEMVVYARLQRSRHHEQFSVDYTIFAPGRDRIVLPSDADGRQDSAHSVVETDPLAPVCRLSETEAWVANIPILGSRAGTRRPVVGSELADTIQLTVVVRLSGS